MLQRPLPFFTVCWVAGTSAACMYSGMQLFLVLAGLALLLTVPIWLGRSRPLFMVIMILSLLGSAGYWEWNDGRNVSRLHASVGKISNEMKAVPAEAWGRITSPVKIDGDRADFEMMIIDLNAQKAVKEKVIVQVKLVREQEVKTAQLWKRGDAVRLAGSLEPPGPARNFGGFDYRQYLRTKGIHWLLKVKGADAVEVRQPEEWSPANVLRWNDDLRHSIGERIDRLFGSFHGGYMKGLIIGDQTDLDPDTFAEFSRLGLTHILAISGMHVAVFVGSLLFIFSACRLTRESSLTAVIFLIPLYVLLTGASPSVIRAGMMGMIGLYAARRGLLKDGKHILCAAALAMLWYNPYYLVNVSFQLSFLVTAGLMIFVPKWMPLLSFLPRWLGSPVAVTAAAQLVSFPLTIYYFNQFSLLSLPANLVLVPLISLIVLPLGMTAVIAGFIWMDLGKWIASLAKWLNTFTFEVIEWMNGSPGFVTIWPSPSLWWIAIYFVVLYFMLHVMEKRKQRQTDIDTGTVDETVPLARDGFGRAPSPTARSGGYRWDGPLRLQAASVSRFAAVRMLGRLLTQTGMPAAVPLFGMFVMLLYTAYQGPSLQGSGRVQFLDVGQGDSILVSTPGGKHVLIDGGGTINFRKEKDTWKERSRPFEVGAKVVVPLLKKRGVHSLDMIVISHNDKDHAGGLQAVLEEIPVNSVVFNGTLSETKDFKKLLETAVAKKIPLYKAGEGEIYRPDKQTEIEFFYPNIKKSYAEGLPVVKDQNHESLVFVLKMNQASFLFTGDADAEAEREILTDQQKRGNSPDSSLFPTAVDVLKIGHHGSKTSTSEEWLAAWKPKTAVISAGVNNMYRHPHPDVVARIKRHQALMFRTDLHGEIQMKISPKGEVSFRTKLSQVGD